jgi:hypothetical protein
MSPIFRQIRVVPVSLEYFKAVVPETHERTNLIGNNKKRFDNDKT